ncbi:hypothetical protein [Brevibacillus laterosporus]|uniref:hypothetical protein n=1 Tax=Brevibacillus laterosporus TaxID=1465 RepID=UPI000E6CFF8D|nr:hypothetical protein [Brevibacillus laterosporus]AYB37576.1 hypothetical protein D5F52_04380 [Brevibacillus laterosporus]
MTAFNFIYDEKRIIVCMDTLSLNENRRPFKFVSKIFLIPHLRSVICGTGNLDLIMDWVNQVQRNIIATDISFLSTITTENLIRLYQKYDYAIGSSTIYQFGYSQIEKKFKGYAYRSTSGFQKEEFPYCSAIKPNTQFEIYDEIQVNGLDDAFIKLMKQQKEEDDCKHDRVGIGGEIHRIFMNEKTCQLDIIYRFSDYEQCYDEMLENLKNQ